MKKEKILSIGGWAIAIPLAALFFWSAYGKITMPENMEMMKLGNWTTIIIIGEITSALLYLFPKTNHFGTLLLSSYMGGAIIIHMTAGISIMLPSVVLIAVWIGFFLRHPQWLCSRKSC